MMMYDNTPKLMLRTDIMQDDEDMPELEDEAEGKGKEPAEEGESKPKIEEVS